MPPPAEPDVSGPDQQGLVTLSGQVSQPEARVLALNQRTARIDGALADTQGRYLFQMPALAGDSVDLWWESDAQDSNHRTFRIPYPAPPMPTVTGPDASGLVVLTGQVPPSGATIYLRDLASGTIKTAQADPNGAYQIAIPASVGDSLELWYLGPVGESKHLTLVVSPPA
jgi:hypothetical protein